MSFGPNCAALSGNHHCLRAEAPGGLDSCFSKINVQFYFDDVIRGGFEDGVLHLDPQI